MQDDKLKISFEKGLGIPLNGVSDELEFGKSEYWDSIAHMKLIAAIENEFNLRLDVDDILGMSSFKKAKEIVSKRLQEKA